MSHSIDRNIIQQPQPQQPQQPQPQQPQQPQPQQPEKQVKAGKGIPSSGFASGVICNLPLQLNPSCHSHSHGIHKMKGRVAAAPTSFSYSAFFWSCCHGPTTVATATAVVFSRGKPIPLCVSIFLRSFQYIYICNIYLYIYLYILIFIRWAFRLRASQGNTRWGESIRHLVQLLDVCSNNRPFLL